MSKRIRGHIRSNVIGYIALFFALSTGSAVALSGSNTVQSDDLGPGAQVKAPDVADNAVNSADVVNNSLTGNDVNALTGADVTNDSLTTSDVNNLTGGDVVNDSLTGADVNESTLQGVDAATVDGANVCDGLVEQTTSTGDPVAEFEEVCAEGPLSIKATCDSSSAGSTTGALAIDTSADDSFFKISDSALEDPDWDAADLEGFVFVTATDAVGSLVRRSFSAGAPDGSQLAGELGIRARNSGGSDGTCHFVLGVIG